MGRVAPCRRPGVNHRKGVARQLIVVQRRARWGDRFPLERRWEQDISGTRVVDRPLTYIPLLVSHDEMPLRSGARRL